MKTTLDQIAAFADHAHGEQKRKYSNERYIAHPLRVMRTCQLYTDDVTILAAALLHDVLEDTSVTQEEIRTYLDTVLQPEEANRTLKYVTELTDVYTKKNFPSLNRRSRKHCEAERLSTISAQAQTIKYADIIDNSVNIAEHDPDFGVVFLREGKMLLQKMNRGNRELYEEALQTITQCLEYLQSKERVS